MIKKEGGVMTLDDLKNYKAVWRDPLIGSYRGRTVITMPPPSSGGVALLQMLNVVEGYKFDEFNHNSAPYLHLLGESMKHAFADRAEHLGDPDFVHVPIRKLTDKSYATWVRGRITPDKTHAPTYYGYHNYNGEKGSTTHFSVIDRNGNAVACTQTVNTRFGSKLLVPKAGIVLNNEIDDFAIHGETGNVYGLIGNQANSLQPHKRPLSSMSPTIVVNNGRPEIVVGASGGPRIINATLQTILNILEFKMPVASRCRGGAHSPPMDAGSDGGRSGRRGGSQKGFRKTRPRAALAKRSRSRPGDHLERRDDERRGGFEKSRAGEDGIARRCRAGSNRSSRSKRSNSSEQNPNTVSHDPGLRSR